MTWSGLVAKQERLMLRAGPSNWKVNFVFGLIFAAMGAFAFVRLHSLVLGTFDSFIAGLNLTTAWWSHRLHHRVERAK